MQYYVFINISDNPDAAMCNEPTDWGRRIFQTLSVNNGGKLSNRIESAVYSPCPLRSNTNRKQTAQLSISSVIFFSI